MNTFLNQIHFPYPNLRKGQFEFIKKVYDNANIKKNILISAPTGIGKTISGLAPVLYLAKQKKLTVICLTSRQTQANQYIKAIKDISAKSKEQINFLAFIGKRNMCVNSNRDLYPPQDFNEFCKKMKEEGKCKFYKNIKNEDFEEVTKSILEESSNSFMTVENFVKLAGSHKLCPYELASKKAFHADVIICDYNYMFSSGIKESFLGKVGRDIDECILVVDEAHNLPDRIRNSYSAVLTTEMIRNAQKELRDFIKTSEYDPYINNIKAIMEEIYFNKMLGDTNELTIKKGTFLESYMKTFNSKIQFADILEKLYEIESLVKEDRIISHIGRIANFLEKWHTFDEDSFFRILEKNITKEKTLLSIKIKCIDPSSIAATTLNNSYASILMSATLSPIKMYQDVLGVENCDLLELDSPFEKENQLTLVIPDITTKYTLRDNNMYEKIANYIIEILNSAHDRNSICFFPSYNLLEKIVSFLPLNTLGRKILKEQKYMTKEEKEEFIEEFQENNSKATVLFAVISGSFAEGLDLPKKMLEMVIVVGLPLGVPDLTTNAIINHFDRKFRKGQMYGYIYPAMNKIIQAGGRCIRTEVDKGVIVLMDSRFKWPLYAQCFPKHWKLKTSNEIKLEVGNFFDNK